MEPLLSSKATPPGGQAFCSPRAPALRGLKVLLFFLFVTEISLSFTISIVVWLSLLNESSQKLSSGEDASQAVDREEDAKTQIHQTEDTIGKNIA